MLRISESELGPNRTGFPKSNQEMVQNRPPHAGINIGTDAAKAEGDPLEILMVGCDCFERRSDPFNSQGPVPKYDPLEFCRFGEVDLTRHYSVCRLRSHDERLAQQKEAMPFDV